MKKNLVAYQKGESQHKPQHVENKLYSRPTVMILKMILGKSILRLLFYYNDDGMDKGART